MRRKIAFFNSFVFETTALCDIIIGKTSPVCKSLQQQGELKPK